MVNQPAERPNEIDVRVPAADHAADVDLSVAALEAAIDREVEALDLVLLRLSTLRLLMAAGRHRMVPTALSDLEVSFDAFEQVADQCRRTLLQAGHATFEDAIEARAEDRRLVLIARVAALRTGHRDLRGAVSATAGSARTALRQTAAADPDGALALPLVSAGHPFLTGER